VGRPQAALTVPPMRGEQKLPEILSREEVGRILDGTHTLRDRVRLMATYGGGLRVSEVVALRAGTIDATTLRTVYGTYRGFGGEAGGNPERLIAEIELNRCAVVSRSKHLGELTAFPLSLILTPVLWGAFRYGERGP
jgi:integrase